MSLLQTKEYLDPSLPYSTLDELQANEEIWDASTLAHIAKCPRDFYYRVERGLASAGPLSRYLIAGSAIHEALDTWAITQDRELSLQAFRERWGDTDRAPVPDNEKHLQSGHLQIVLKNYFDWSLTGTSHTPVHLTLADLDLSNVLAARWRLLEDRLILSESSILYRIELPGLEPFNYAVKPDSLVQTSTGELMCRDYKTSSSYLSEWKISAHICSNQIRGYVWVLSDMLDKEIDGGLICHMYVGDRASDISFNGTRFREDPFLWQGEHAEEAIRNQRNWIDLVEYHRNKAQWPQVANLQCRSCNFKQLCAMDPGIREGKIYDEWNEDTRVPFFDI